MSSVFLLSVYYVDLLDILMLRREPRMEEMLLVVAEIYIYYKVIIRKLWQIVVKFFEVDSDTFC